VIEARRSRDFLTAPLQLDSGWSGNNPADLCERKPEFRGEAFSIDSGSGSGDLVLFPGIRRL
jgi:hypothetical protein